MRFTQMFKCLLWVARLCVVFKYTAVFDGDVCRRSQNHKAPSMYTNPIDF